MNDMLCANKQEVMYEKNVVNYMESFDLGAELSWAEVGEREGIGPNQWPPAAAAPGRYQYLQRFVSSILVLIDTLVCDSNVQDSERRQWSFTTFLQSPAKWFVSSYSALPLSRFFPLSSVEK